MSRNQKTSISIRIPFFPRFQHKLPTHLALAIPLAFLFVIGTLVSVFSTLQVLDAIGNAHRMLGSHRVEFATVEGQFKDKMDSIRLLLLSSSQTRRPRIPPLEVSSAAAISAFSAANFSPNPLHCRCNPSNQCPAGPPGQKGPPGTNGTPGLPGSPGFPGLPGNSPQVLIDSVRNCRLCPMGEKGEPGKAGTPGYDGPNGTSGVPGRPGKPGPPGKIGKIGPPGQTGLPGRTGIKGIAGIAAIFGEKGEHGAKGQSGRAGRRGRTGPAGPAGRNGQPGLSGAQGETGKRGRNGATGEPGPAGENGAPGTDALYCPCPREKIKTELLRPTGYGPKNPFGKKRPIGKGEKQRKEGGKEEVELQNHSHGIGPSNKGRSEEGNNSEQGAKRN